MTDLPTGAVTFLFTDIEGSTSLWEQHHEAMSRALARHDTILRQTIAACGGSVFKMVGDEVCAAFASAPAALAAALAAQRALQTAPWDEVGSLRVRMALHTGTVEVSEGDYFGPPLNRVARLLAASHGGQVLLSRATQELVRDHLPPEVVLHNLGEHRLKDLTRPEQIFQLVAPELPADFPPLRTLGAHRTNLPAQPTLLIGREQAVMTAGALLRRPDVRVLTLTGPGGTGKTRLGMQIAAEQLDAFADGVWFVNLAPISDPALVIPTIAQTLGVKEAGSQPIVETLKTYLRDKQQLLLLDNFEHLLDAAPGIAALLAAPGLKVLVTSRAALHLSGEHEYPVPPLALPDRARLPPTEVLAHYGAVALFVQRAQAARPDFQLTGTNAPAVAEICTRLDGLPLAIELAAARSKLLSPQALLARLTSRLQLLTGGPRDLPARQQTLRGTIDWSYNLLEDGEQALFRRLGVFVGGCTLEAVEAVWNLDDWRLELGDASPSIAPSRSAFSLLDGLAALVDQSLLRQEEQSDGEPRFIMLETIREYAVERLAASGEATITRQLHAHFYLALAETAEPRLTTGEQFIWLERLEREHDNLRAALAWSQTAAGGAELGLRLAGALCWFWYFHGHCTEGRRWLHAALTQTGTVPAPWRAKACSAIGTLAFAQSAYDEAVHFHDQALALYRELDDRKGIAFALSNLGGQFMYQGDFTRAVGLLAEGLGLARAIANHWLMATILSNLGVLAREQGDIDQATVYYQESLVLCRQVGDRWLTAAVLFNLAEVLCDRGEYNPALPLLEESLLVWRDHGDRWSTAFTLQLLGKVAQAQGDITRAAALYTEALGLCQDVGYQRGIAEGLERLATLAAGKRAFERAAQIWGAAETVREASHAPIPPIDRPAYEQAVDAVRQQLGTAAFTTAWALGRAMTPEQILQCRNCPTLAQTHRQPALQPLSSRRRRPSQPSPPA